MVRKMKEITTSEHRVRQRRGGGIGITWQAPRDSCTENTCVGTCAALHSTAARLATVSNVSWQRAANGHIFWLMMTPIVTFTDAAHRQVHHGGK